MMGPGDLSGQDRGVTLGMAGTMEPWGSFGDGKAMGNVCGSIMGTLWGHGTMETPWGSQGLGDPSREDRGDPLGATGPLCAAPTLLRTQGCPR